MTNPAVYYIKIDNMNVGQRLDNFLISKLKDVPKSHVYRILRKGEVRVNKKRAKPEYRLCLGDDVRIPPVRISDKPVKLTPNKRALDLLEGCVLYEDDHLLVLNKPSGVAVHAGSGVDYGLIDILHEKYPNQHHVLVHRLDKGTSGCLLIAKDRPTLIALHAAWRENTCVKIYTLLTEGLWSKSRVTVDMSLQKNSERGGERVVIADEAGKMAITHFEVIKTFSDATLLQARIDTGRTHQIRVHAARMGHPVAGDDKYGGAAFNKGMRLYGLKRLFLHASELTFPVPHQGNRMTIKAPLPEDLEAVLRDLP